MLERLGLDLKKRIRGATTRETTFSASDLRAVEGILASAEFCDLGEPCAVFDLEVVLQGVCPFGKKAKERSSQERRVGEEAHGDDPEAVSSAKKGRKVRGFFEEEAKAVLGLEVFVLFGIETSESEDGFSERSVGLLGVEETFAGAFEIGFLGEGFSEQKEGFALVALGVEL